MDERKIGYIGLGNMGGGMAAHLVASGYDVVVYDLRAEAAQVLVDKGATAAGSPREVATRCEIIISSLPTPRSMEDAVMGENGIAAGIGASKIYIDMSAIDPDTTRKVGDAARVAGGSIAKVFARNFEPGFKLALSHKDLGLAAQLAASPGSSNMIGRPPIRGRRWLWARGLATKTSMRQSRWRKRRWAWRLGERIRLSGWRGRGRARIIGRGGGCAKPGRGASSSGIARRRARPGRRL